MSVNVMERANYLWSKTNRWHRGLFIFLLVELRIVPGGQLGFTCNDPALSHPFTGDTISWKLLLATTVFLPFAAMLIVEKIYHNHKTSSPKQQAVCWYKEYLFGLLINLIIIQSLKLFVGSPRPHFFDTCSPKEAATCEGSEFVSSYTCTKAHWLSQSNKSFPSGHTSLAVHAGVFLAYYLHKRTSSPCTNRVRIVQLTCLITAIVCGISRMIDHRHHWWDVLAGAVLAAPVLYFTIYSLCNNFNCPTASVEDPAEHNDTKEPLMNVKETTKSLIDDKLT